MFLVKVVQLSSRDNDWGLWPQNETYLCRRFTEFVIKYQLMSKEILIVPILGEGPESAIFTGQVTESEAWMAPCFLDHCSLTEKKINQYGARNEINFLRYVCRPFCSWTGFRRRSGQVPFSCWVVIFSFRLCRPCLELAVSIEISVWTWNEVANKPHR